MHAIARDKTSSGPILAPNRFVANPISSTARLYDLSDKAMVMDQSLWHRDAFGANEEGIHRGKN
jgi:hypothetical protein